MSLLKVGTRVRVITGCPMGRWNKDETGVLVKNDYDIKYDYKVEFDRAVYADKDDKLIQGRLKRVFYFYSDEVESIEDEFECWECATPLTVHSRHPIGGSYFCGGCASSLRQQARQDEAEERRSCHASDD